ncbi:MAG: ribosomal protein S18-alanine N-acetyltransferase [Oligoflexia bacterium]|nr:ribosomal protein S18-alanine N-acetyltransferase [Oligoflexia bacterium]
MKKLSYSPRPATEDDISQVAELEKGSMLKPWSKSSLDEELTNENSIFWVVTDDDTDSEVLAYAIVRKALNESHLLTILVKKEHRKQGIAEWFLRKLINKCEKEQIESMFLDVSVKNTSAIGLYQKLGFIIVRTIKDFYPDNISAYSMVYKMKQIKIDLPEKEATIERKNFN